MMEYINGLIEGGSMPLVVAIALGLISAVSPCPMTTNISAIGYLAKNLSSGRSTFVDGLLYTLGRIVTYSILGAVAIYILRQGLSIDPINDFLSSYGEMILPPVLIFMALITLNVFKFGHHHHHAHPNDNITDDDCGTCEHQHKHYYSKGGWGAFVMGLIFALAFCPINGMFFFGMLAPVSAKATGGYFMPMIYGLITGLPVVIVSWILAFSFEHIKSFNTKIKSIEKWCRIGVAAMLIACACYFAYEAYFMESCGCVEHHHHH